MNKKTEEKSSLKIMSELVLLVKPMLGIVCLAVLLGVAGFFCATAIPVAGALCLLSVMGYPIGISLRALFLLMAVFAVARDAPLWRTGIESLYRLQAVGDDSQ